MPRFLLVHFLLLYSLLSLGGSWPGVRTDVQSVTFAVIAAPIILRENSESGFANLTEGEPIVIQVNVTTNYTWDNMTITDYLDGVMGFAGEPCSGSICLIMFPAPAGGTHEITFFVTVYGLEAVQSPNQTINFDVYLPPTTTPFSYPTASCQRIYTRERSQCKFNCTLNNAILSQTCMHSCLSARLNWMVSYCNSSSLLVVADCVDICPPPFELCPALCCRAGCNFDVVMKAYLPPLQPTPTESIAIIIVIVLLTFLLTFVIFLLLINWRRMRIIRRVRKVQPESADAGSQQRRMVEKND
jgi:hypothetical protein